MNLFASASRKQPLEKPLVREEPSEFHKFQHAFKRRCRMGRFLHKVNGKPYVKPKEETK